MAAEKIQFDHQAELAKISDGNHQEKLEKTERFERLLTEQRIYTGFFIGEIIQAFETGTLDEESSRALFHKYKDSAHWTEEQEMHIYNSLRDILNKHQCISRLRNQGLDDEKIYHRFIGSNNGPVSCKEVPGGVAFLVKDRKDYDDMISEDDPLKMEDEQAAYDLAHYLQDYSTQHHDVDRNFGRSVIAVNLTDIDRLAQAYEEKYQKPLDKEAFISRTIKHEDFHLCLDLYFSKKFFRTGENYQQSWDPDRHDFGQLVQLRDELQNEVVAFLLENETNERILKLISEAYLPHIEKITARGDQKSESYKSKVKDFIDRLPQYLKAAKEIIEYFGDDTDKACAVLWSESIDKWPRLARQINKFGIK